MVPLKDSVTLTQNFWSSKQHHLVVFNVDKLRQVVSTWLNAPYATSAHNLTLYICMLWVSVASIWHELQHQAKVLESNITIKIPHQPIEELAAVTQRDEHNGFIESMAICLYTCVIVIKVCCLWSFTANNIFQVSPLKISTSNFERSDSYYS